MDESRSHPKIVGIHGSVVRGTHGGAHVVKHQNGETSTVIRQSRQSASTNANTAREPERNSRRAVSRTARRRAPDRKNTSIHKWNGAERLRDTQCISKQKNAARKTKLHMQLCHTPPPSVHKGTRVYVHGAICMGRLPQCLCLPPSKLR